MGWRRNGAEGRVWGTQRYYLQKLPIAAGQQEEGNVWSSRPTAEIPVVVNIFCLFNRQFNLHKMRLVAPLFRAHLLGTCTTLAAVLLERLVNEPMSRRMLFTLHILTLYYKNVAADP